MSDIRQKIKQYGDQKQLQALQEYVKNLELEKLTSFIGDHIRHRNSSQTWNYLLQGFTEESDSHYKRAQVIFAVLRVLDGNEISETHTDSILTRLKVELPKFKSTHLVELCDLCIDRIQKGDAAQTSWKDLLPELLIILVGRDYFMYNDTETSGVDFKTQIITSLCMINWAPDIITALAAMFSDVPLSKEEHLQIVNKLGQCMDKLECQEIPGFTYQLLKLCSTQNSKCIFLRLQYYFTDRIYKNLGKDLEPSSDTNDFDEITDASEADAIQVESTVLFHIHHSATLGHGSIKEYINSFKNMLKAPEFILHPFQLTVLLTISTVSIFEEQAMEVIRACIIRVITEDVKKAESAWFRKMVTTTTSISNVISAITENSLKERHLVVLGLINLGFILLGAGAGLGNKNIAEAQWELATFLLLKLMKKKREVSSTVIQQICNRIITGTNVAHLTDCLHQMCRSMTYSVLECKNIIIQLIEQILQVPGAVARHIIDAIIPLVKVSQAVRDNLILILRKALYSRKVETRQMAVTGFLKLLKNLKISNLQSLSQNSSSNSTHSFLTQISLDCQAQTSTANRFTNEALCLEVLGILRRCFMQQSEVRAEFYEGLYDAVCMNSELGIPVLDILWVHFNQFCVNDEAALPPLLFTDTLCSKNVDVIVQEPLGHLIFAIGRIVTKVSETHDPTNRSIKRFIDILQNLCDGMAKCELLHFELDDGTDLLDRLPASQIKYLILWQALSVYDGLIGYLICEWNPKSEKTAQKINSLFQAYTRFLEFGKNLNKPKKAEGKGKKTKQDTFKKPAGLKQKVFKPPLNVVDFQTVDKILRLLHEQTVPWTDNTQANILKVKREFHRYILNVVLQLVHTLKTSKCIESIHTKPYFVYCSEIAAVLYERVIKRLEFVIDFDCTTAVLALDCFHIILSLIVTYYKEKLSSFLSKVGLKNKDTDLGEHLMPFIEVHQEFFDKEDEEYSDPESKKLHPLLMSTYTIFVLNLPTTGPHTTKALDWIKQYADNTISTNKNVGSALVSLMLNMHIRCKNSSSVFENVAARLCDIVGTVDQDKPECAAELKILNEGTAMQALSTLVNSLKTMLDEADWLIQRFRAVYSMIIYPGSEKVERRRDLLKNQERDLCCHLCQIINVCALISNMAITQPPQIEMVFKILTHLYNTLTLLTKYFTLQSSKINPAFQSARFERVLKISGKPLSNRVNEFITFIEQSHHSSPETSQPKRQSKDPNTLKTKVLRETRFIPKLVFELEQFGKNVITLSNKTKIDLLKYIGIGIARDFRIKVPALKEALEKIGPANVDDTISEAENDEQNENDDEERATTDVSMEVEKENDEDNESDEEAASPPKKKPRKSK